MSKVNAMQAMREARYAARKPVTAPAVPDRPVRVDAPAPAAAPSRAGSQAVTKGATEAPVSDSVSTSGAAELFPATEAASEAPQEALCGHRSMNNRVCKRPSGHAEKNHRYN